MYLALASFAITCALYLATMPTFYNVTAIAAGKMAPYASLEADLVPMLKEFFAVQIFFWLTLWAVKWSLLFMFKALTNGIALYTNIWWGALAFTVLTLIGCIISNFTSCSSMDAWFTAGMNTLICFSSWPLHFTHVAMGVGLLIVEQVYAARLETLAQKLLACGTVWQWMYLVIC